MTGNAFVVCSFSQFTNYYCERLPAPGETLPASKMRISYGGKGMSQSYAVSKTGAHVRVIGRVGNDAAGHSSEERFERTNVDYRYITFDDECPTGQGLIVRDCSGQNLIVLYAGANDKFCEDDYNNALDYIKTCEIGGFQLESNNGAVEALIRRTCEMNIKTFLDPAPAKILDSALYPYITYIKPNETEARTLTGIEVKDEDSAREAGRWLLERGVRGAAIITMGEKGAVYVSRECCKVYPPAVAKVVDTVGAGDAFAGGFIGAIARGLSDHEAMIEACALCGVAVSHTGTLFDFFDCDDELLYNIENYAKAME